MRRFAIKFVLLFCSVILVVFLFCGCGGSDSQNQQDENATEQIEIKLSEKSVISQNDQSDIRFLLQDWASAYSTNYLTHYNECVSDELKYEDSPNGRDERTANFFDTVIGCSVTNIDFENAKKIDDNNYKLVVDYIIVYDENFEETNGLKKGENKISAEMLITRSVVGEFYINSLKQIK